MDDIEFIKKNHGVIVCETCDIDLYYFKRWKEDLAGSFINSEDLVVLDFRLSQPQDGEMFICKFCKTPLVFRQKIKGVKNV